MQKKYFNNKGHPTAIYIPEGKHYQLRKLEEEVLSCSASNGNMQIGRDYCVPAIAYDKENPFADFEGSRKSKGETIIAVGTEYCILPGKVEPEGYVMHEIDEEWGSNLLEYKDNYSVDLNKMSLNALTSIMREVQKALGREN